MKPPPLRNDCFAMPPGVDWTPVDDALDVLRQGMRVVVGHQEVRVPAAGGRVLADHVIARQPNPPFSNAAVDGYGFAFSSATPATPTVRDGVDRDRDRVVTLPVTPGRAAAGAPHGTAVPAGHALRILTGAPLPAGVDTVVLEEDVSSDGARVSFRAGLRPGANTRPAGEDVRAGARLFESGHRLRPQDLALLTACGIGTVPVHDRLRVAVLSTGDEIAEVGAGRVSAGESGAIYDSNRPMLLDLIRGWRHGPIDLGRVRDDPGRIRDALDRGAEEADAILVTGGASAGDEDHVSRLLKAEGELQTWRVAIKPGRPLAMALWRRCPVFGLPGNPVAAFVCSLLFARPALRVLAGEDWDQPSGFRVPAGFSKRKKPGRREYLRARLDGEGRAVPFASEGSGRISSLAWSDGLVELGDGARDLREGDPVRYLPYSGFGVS